MHVTSGAYMAAQIISPAENVAGLIIRTGAFSGPAGGFISTGTAAATGITDTTKPMLMYLPTSNVLQQLLYPIYLPPGYGLWAKSSSTIRAFITYDLLT